MWHVETDYFALAMFLIMLIKERPSHRFDHDAQGRAFYCVLIVGIVSAVAVLHLCAGAQRHAGAATVPIIAVTADALSEERKRTLEAGMDAHLSKPIDPAALYAALAKYAAKGRGQNLSNPV